jgi:2-methylcitrate dehydratase PrpD
MVKPLHAGLAARNAVLAALLANAGVTASDRAIDGPQGLFTAMSASSADASAALAGLGRRWEILETGITVKLYPSCAGTHPALDALIDLSRETSFTANDVERIEIDVDAITPTVLIYENPATGLEGKFSMPFCAAAAVAAGRVDLDTFAEAGVSDRATRRLMPRVTVRVDPALGKDAPPLTEARVIVTLHDGRRLERMAKGARGYPERPASAAELEAKFRTCAARALDAERVNGTLAALRDLEHVRDVRQIVGMLEGPPAQRT